MVVKKYKVDTELADKTEVEFAEVLYQLLKDGGTEEVLLAQGNAYLDDTEDRHSRAKSLEAALEKKAGLLFEEYEYLVLKRRKYKEKLREAFETATRREDFRIAALLRNTEKNGIPKLSSDMTKLIREARILLNLKFK